MNEAIFYKSFYFNIYKFDKYHLNDQTKLPSTRHSFGCIIKGSAKITSEKVKLELKPNEIFYIPKGLKYMSQWFSENGEPIEFYSFGFEFSPTNKQYILQKIECSGKARKIFCELCQEIPATDKGIGKLYYFFGEVSDGMKQSQSTHSSITVERACEYMWEHSDFKISDVAKHCNVSTPGIYSAFKKHLGRTPNDVRLGILCEKAVSLLSTTDNSVQEISDTLGFSSASYFRKILKEHTGKSPREIRKASLSI